MRRLTRLAALALILAAVFAAAPAGASALSWGRFNAVVIEGLHAPVTLHTRRALAAEAQAEGGSARNNLYNTTRRMPGSTFYNVLQRNSNGEPVIGVQNYVSGEQGEEATILTLKENSGDNGYWRIRRRMRRNASAEAIVRAFGESRWGTNLELVLAVLHDIQHDRSPNTLGQLEAKGVTP